MLFVRLCRHSLILKAYLTASAFQKVFIHYPVSFFLMFPTSKLLHPFAAYFDQLIPPTFWDHLRFQQTASTPPSPSPRAPSLNSISALNSVTTSQHLPTAAPRIRAVLQLIVSLSISLTLSILSIRHPFAYVSYHFDAFPLATSPPSIRSVLTSRLTLPSSRDAHLPIPPPPQSAK